MAQGQGNQRHALRAGCGRARKTCDCLGSRWRWNSHLKPQRVEDFQASLISATLPKQKDRERCRRSTSKRGSPGGSPYRSPAPRSYHTVGAKLLLSRRRSTSKRRLAGRLALPITGSEQKKTKTTENQVHAPDGRVSSSLPKSAAGTCKR